MHAAPMYIAETAPSHIRGQLISMKEFLIVFGMLVSNSYSDTYEICYLDCAIGWILGIYST